MTSPRRAAGARSRAARPALGQLELLTREPARRGVVADPEPVRLDRIQRLAGVGLGVGRITLTVRPSRRNLAGVPRRAVLRLRVTATTRSGRRTVMTRKVALRG